MADESRSRPLWHGLGSGALLALADWLATGIERTPPALVLSSLGAGLVAGAATGALGRWRGQASLPVALVLALGLALEGLSVASKELSARALPLGVALVLLASGTGLWLVHRRCARNPFAGWTAVAALPLGAGFAARLGHGPWVHLGAGWVFVALALWAGPSSSRFLRALPWLGLVALGAHAQGEGSAILRRAPPATTAPSGRPSLVLLVVDTLRADEVAADGALERFGRDGVVFRQCVSAAPWTLPSVASLLTGRHPSEHGALTAGSRLSEGAVTLAELLSAQGYATGAFTGGAFVGAAHGLGRGFEHFDPTCERTLNTYGGHAPLLWRLAKNRYFPQRWLMDLVDAYRGLAGALEAATDWAEDQADRPKFVFLHTYQVHDYYLYEPDFDDAVLASTPAPADRFAGRLWVHPSELLDASPADIAHYRALYRGRIAALDRLFPSLVEALTAILGEDAVWIVTSDHGEGFDVERHRVHHGGRLHEDLLRVPLVLRARGRLAPGQVVADTVRSIDVLPTALDLLGMRIPDGLSGQSLLPALRGEAPFPATAFAEDRAPGRELLSVRKDGWKWIEGPRGGELYQLSADPLESAPVTSESSRGLAEELAGFRARHPLPSRIEAEVDATTLEHLRTLGYTE